VVRGIPVPNRRAAEDKEFMVPWDEAVQLIHSIFPDAIQAQSRSGSSDFRNAPELVGTNLGRFLGRIRNSSRFASVHNRLFLGPKLEKEGELILLTEENQNVAYWGVRTDSLASDDPPIYFSNNVEPIVWEKEWDTASAYFSAFALWQAVNGGLPVNAVALNVDAAINLEIERSFQQVALSENGSNCKFFSSENFDALIAVKQSHIYAAAKTEDSWVVLDKLNIEWDYCSLDEE
jgi:hypothetical protein